MTRNSAIALIASLAVCCCSLRADPTAHEDSPADKQRTAKEGDATAAVAFEAIVPVLRHPRCMNCHSTGDYPRQGDDSHRHSMRVRRGPQGHGVDAVECNGCHQDRNTEGLHSPPGATGWHLPPPSMPMIWEGLSDHQLCTLLKDKRQNGGKTVQQIVEHMHTPLVLWGWDPGEGRAPVPVPQKRFLAEVERWAATGAACPE